MNFDKLDNLSDKKLSVLEKQMANEYSIALKGIKKDIANFKGNYDDPAEMFKYQRNVLLEKQVADKLNQLNRATKSGMFSMLKDTAQTNYLYTGFLLETELQKKMQYAILNDTALKSLLSNPLTGESLEDNLKWKNAELVRNVKNSLSQGLIRGESIQDIAGRMDARLAGDMKERIKVARTENTRVMAQSRQKSMEHGAKYVPIVKEWVATLDGVTRDRHGALDGQVVEVDEEFEIDGYSALGPGQFGAPEMDINCRCRVVTKIKGFENEEEYRRDNETGEVIKAKSYEDWKKERVADAPPTKVKDGKSAVKARWDEAKELAVNDLEGYEKLKDSYTQTSRNDDVYTRSTLEVNALSQEERMALKAYTGANHRPINAYLRNGKKYRPNMTSIDKKRINEHLPGIDSAFTKISPLDSDIKLFREISGNDLENIFNNAVAKKITIADEILEMRDLPITISNSAKLGLDTSNIVLDVEEKFRAKLLGSEAIDLGYMSTSYEAGAFGDFEVRFNIFAGKGSVKGAYLSEISQYLDGEKEVLLNRGVKLKVTDVKIVEDKLQDYKIIMDMFVVGG